MAHSNRQLHIGNICIQWSNLEYSLATTIWLLIGVKVEVGKIVTANLDIKQRATMALALAHQTNAPIYLKNAIKKVLERLRDDLISERNQAVHATHFGEIEGGSEIELHRGKGGRARRAQLDANLARTGAAIAEVSKAFHAELMKFADLKIEEAKKKRDQVGELRIILANISPASDEGVR